MSRITLGYLLASALIVGGCSAQTSKQLEKWATTVERPDTTATTVSQKDVPEATVQRSAFRFAGRAASLRAHGDDDLFEAERVAPNKGPYVLDSGDKLRVFVYGQPSLSRIYTVDQSGKIVIPLIGPVRARGRTTYRLTHAVTATLGAQFVRDPQVVIDLHQSRPFFILGEVRSAGQYDYVSGMTVETAVAIAGGFSARANERAFRITRRERGAIKVIKAPAHFAIKPGDTIKVLERFF